MFKSVDARTDARTDAGSTPARLVYYKLNMSLRLMWGGGGGFGLGCQSGCERRIEVFVKIQKKIGGGGGGVGLWGQGGCERRI